MSYGIGCVFLIGACWLLWSGLAHRRQVRGAARQNAASPTLHPSLAALRDFLPTLIIFGLGLVGLKVTVLYALLGGGGLISLFDLIGFLLLLAAYGVWLHFSTRYRQVGYLTTPATTAFAGPQEPGREERHELESVDRAGVAAGARRGAGHRVLGAEVPATLQGRAAEAR